MKAALAPVRRVSSTAHVVVVGQPSGRLRGRTKADQGASFLNAIQEPPPACERCAGMRASGMVSGGDGAFAGW